MKKNLLTIVILALLIVNIALTAIMMISVTSTNNKTAALVDTIAMVMNLELVTPGEEGEEEVQVSLADTAIYSIPDQFTIPLKPDTVTNADGTVTQGKSVYMVFNVSLSLNTKASDYKKGVNIDNISTYDSWIKEEIEAVVSSHTQEFCTNNRAELQAELLREIQGRLNDTDSIYGVSITDVVFG